MAISAADVKALRDRTGVGMMECKKALTEAGGDADKAVEILRERLKGKMDDRTDRAAAEGVIAVAVSGDDKSVAMIEVNTETDFTAKNADFIAACQKIADIALQGPDGDVQVNDAITEVIDNIRITTKENASFARGLKVTAPDGGSVGIYLHHNNKIAGQLVLTGDVDGETRTGLAQHISALDGMMLPVPAAIDPDALPAADVEAKKAEFVEEATATGKPAEIAEKIATGKLNKWLDDNTLVGQAYIKDMTGKSAVRDVLPAGVAVASYTRYAVGTA